ncbi:MAG: DUF420 domain-containing protein [Phycisphaerae bacterium]|nr:DUF420 domain-containing protein [Phycisphaerae bacterium]
MTVQDLPHLNATLNAVATLMILAGFAMVRSKRIIAHRACMLGAVAVSSAFLASYLVYHFNVGSVKYEGVGTIRAVYFFILISHVVLAAVVPVLVGITLYRAFRNQIDHHRRIARWTLPIWLYVSVTGVIVYWMLYRM